MWLGNELCVTTCPAILLILTYQEACPDNLLVCELQCVCSQKMPAKACKAVPIGPCPIVCVTPATLAMDIAQDLGEI